MTTEVAKQIAALPGYFINRDMIVNAHHLTRTTERNFNVVYDYAKGYSCEELGKKYQLSTGRIYYILDKMERIYRREFCD